MNKDEALKLISEVISNKECDEQFLRDIEQAISDWKCRIIKIINPYVVWYFNGSNWEKATAVKEQVDAYRDWYRLTDCGKSKNNVKCSTYYILGQPDNPPDINDVLKEEEEEDNFSIPYLLNKSFGC